MSDDTRLRAALPTIRALSLKGAKVILLAHFDRPKGKRVAEMSLRPLVRPLADLLEQPVAFADELRRDPTPKRPSLDTLDNGGVVLLENLRFHACEKKNAGDFVDQPR